jgi:hypothetical protein
MTNEIVVTPIGKGSFNVRTVNSQTVSDLVEIRPTGLVAVMTDIRAHRAHNAISSLDGHTKDRVVLAALSANAC